MIIIDDIEIEKIDKVVDKIKELEAKKMIAMQAKMDCEIEYIKISNELRSHNMEFSKIMATTKFDRRKYPHPDQLWKDKIIADVGKCEDCNAIDRLSVHHITPLAIGGTNERNNLKVVCFSCHNNYHKYGVR